MQKASEGEMGDKSRTKEALLAELAALRQRVTELEAVKREYEWVEEELTKAHYYDPLTGLPSSTLFFNHLSQAVALARRNGRQLAVLFFSLDRLRLINDNLGHQTGDLILREVASRVAACLRESDVLARPGRNEFMILLPEIARAEDVVPVAERVFAALTEPLLVQDQELVVTGNLGVSVYPNDGTSAGPLIRHAYAAMHRARDKGCDTYFFYSQRLNERAFSRLMMENSLRIALQREEFFLYYQPQMDLASGCIVGVEALLRWRHPELGLVSPAEFVPIMEEIGLIVPLSEWVLRTACAQNRAFQEVTAIPLRMAVNLSPRQLYQPGLAQIVGRVLEETGLEPQRLVLELTEGALARNVTTTVATLGALGDMGVKIAVDDFGMGYSSLSYLRHFPIDKLKIDKTFIDSIATDHNNAAISRAIIALAHSLRLDVIAEGVETEEQLEYLRVLGCNEVQGYLIGHPVSADDLSRVLARNTGGMLPVSEKRPDSLDIQA